MVFHLSLRRLVPVAVPLGSNVFVIAEGRLPPARITTPLVMLTVPWALTECGGRKGEPTAEVWFVKPAG